MLSLRRSTMENLTARHQITNCACKSSELRTTCIRQTITMTVIVLGLLSAVSSGQVGGPVPANDFPGLHINGGFANWPPKKDGFTGFGTFRLWANGNGTQRQWAQPYPISVKVLRQRKPTVSTAAAAPDAKEVVLHNFASPPYGAYPAWGVIRDSAGNLYGTTDGAYSDVGGGGTNNAGVVFKVDTSGNETVLYSFSGGDDGSPPIGLIRDSARNLYGTTYGGGALGAGVVFKVDKSGHETVLYTFTGGADGGNPYAVVRDSAGNLYGVTESGGNGVGVVFKLDTSGNETVLYSFTGGTDGAYPNSIIRDAGIIYGTTTYGGNASGTSGGGVVFKLDMSGHETVLYTFTGGADGSNSDAGVIRDSAGHLL